MFTESTDSYLSLQQVDITNRINHLENLLQKKEKGNPPPDTYLFLSLLYSHKNNPAPDFVKAVNAIDQYEEMASLTESEHLEIQHMKNLLLATNCPEPEHDENAVKQEKHDQTANESLMRDNKSLQDQCVTLKRKNEKLTKENQTMKRLIDQLKMLDIELEQKKRTIQ